MLPVVHFALGPGALALGDFVLRAYDCLRAEGIKPVGFVCGADPQMTLAPATHKRALAALLAAGFEFVEV